MSGIPSKSGIASTTERELVWWLAKGYGMDDAARKVGLPSTAALYKYKRTAAFADDLRAALRDRLGTELAPRAVRVLDEIMSDVKTPARVRVDAAKALLDRSGFTAGAANPSDNDKGLEEMSRAELEAILIEGRGRRERAQQVVIDADYTDETPAAPGLIDDDAFAVLVGENAGPAEEGH
jgi:hypothetical protein